MAYTQFQFRRDTAANWVSNNPILAEGEIGVETDGNSFKIGDGVTAWNSLVYPTFGIETDPVFSASASSSITTQNLTNWNAAYGWGDHAAAGYLDEYEEGTWTPVLNSFNGDATFTYAHQRGYYTKVGRLVTVALWVQARATSIGTGASALLENLPFPQSTSFIRRHGSAAFGRVSGFVTTQPTGVYYIEGRTTSMFLNGITPSNFNTVSDMSLYGQFFFYTA